MPVYAGYYNEARTHLALRKETPVSRSIERHGRIIAEPVVIIATHEFDFRQAQRASFPASTVWPMRLFASAN